MPSPDYSDETSPTESRSLGSRIEELSAVHATEFPVEVQRLFARKTEQIIASGLLARSPIINSTVEDFELPDNDGTLIRLSEKAAQGPVVLSFYRGSWCPYCSLEFQALLEAVPQFQSYGTTVLAVSPQVRDLKAVPPGTRGFHNLSDKGNLVARRFGLVFPLGEEIGKIYQGFGIHLDRLNGDESLEIPVPATYIIDRDLTVRFAYANADQTCRAEPSGLLANISELAA